MIGTVARPVTAPCPGIPHARPYDGVVQPPEERAPDGRAPDTWVGLTTDPLPVDVAAAWAVRPDCGAVVTFSGTVRDHAEGRPGVSRLTYEAYEGEVEPRLLAIADAARRQWPDVGRLVLLHRTGVLGVGESSVVVVASSPHRHDAFEAARWCIDTLKATVPIWKRETWSGGEAWGLDVTDVAEVPAAEVERR
jgi:molybdopterin synthase catalytic subunit